MAGESKTTTDHEEIKRWVEERGGHPATVRTTAEDGEPGLLRIDFPGYSGEQSLEQISWDEFFQKFDEKNLAFLYQEETAGGEESRFVKLISREAGREGAGAEQQRPEQPERRKARPQARAKSKAKPAAKPKLKPAARASAAKKAAPAKKAASSKKSAKSNKRSAPKAKAAAPKKQASKSNTRSKSKDTRSKSGKNARKRR